MVAAQEAGTLGEAAQGQDVPLLASPRRIMRWLCGLLDAGGGAPPAVVLKALDVITALCTDRSFRDALRAVHWPSGGRVIFIPHNLYTRSVMLFSIRNKQGGTKI